MIPSASDRTIVYIDGYNLYHGMLEVYGRKYMWLDLASFGQSLLSDSKQQLIAVKYLTSHAPGGEQFGKLAPPATVLECAECAKAGRVRSWSVSREGDAL
jgi:hypothetical protein